jgi:hypothetical protein
MENAMTPLGASIAAASINSRKWGRIRHSVVIVVGQYPEGVELSQRNAERLIAGERRWIHRQLVALVEDRVLEVVELPAGSRGTIYRLNPMLREWRNVPWLTDPDAVAWRILEAGGMFHAEHDRVTNPDLVTRPLAASRQNVVTRSKHRVTKTPPESLVTRCRTASQGEALRRAMHRVTNEGGAVESLYEERGKSSDAPRADENSLSNEPEGIHQAARELAGAVGARGVWGRPRTDLAGLIDVHGLRDVLAGITATDPTGLQVPSMVAAVADRLRGIEERGGEDPQEATDRRAANLRTMIDLYDGDDPKRAQLLEELQNLESVTGTCHNVHQEVAE